MYLNNYSVRIPQGSEDNGYVLLRHGQNYQLTLRNKNPTRCNARVEIDGTHVGTWRLEAHQSATLERPANDTGKFTFYRIGTEEARKVHPDQGDPNAGLVKVVFTPEAEPRPLKVDAHYTFTYPGPSVTPTWVGDFQYVSGTADDTGSSAAHCYNVSDGDKALSSSQSAMRSAGVTGLSGRSNQWFGSAPWMALDYSKQTTIHLRLVCRDVDEPRPLTQFSTPVPPRVG